MEKINNTILFIGAHPDDIEIGCGGTVSKYVSEGYDIIWLILSDCKESLPLQSNDALVLEAEGSAKLLAKTTPIQYYYPVRKFTEHRDDILQSIIAVRNKFNPSIVFCHNPKDIHQDHAVVGNETIRAFSRHSSVLFYASPYNMSTINNKVYVELTDDDILNKMKSLECYRSQIDLNRKYFSKDYIYGLAKAYGIDIGAEYAEAFEPFRYIL